MQERISGMICIFVSFHVEDCHLHVGLCRRFSATGSESFGVYALRGWGGEVEVLLDDD